MCLSHLLRLLLLCPQQSQQNRILLKDEAEERESVYKCVYMYITKNLVQFNVLSLIHPLPLVLFSPLHPLTRLRFEENIHPLKTDVIVPKSALEISKSRQYPKVYVGQNTVHLYAIPSVEFMHDLIPASWTDNNMMRNIS